MKMNHTVKVNTFKFTSFKLNAALLSLLRTICRSVCMFSNHPALLDRVLE